MLRWQRALSGALGFAAAHREAQDHRHGLAAEGRSGRQTSRIGKAHRFAPGADACGTRTSEAFELAEGGLKLVNEAHGIRLRDGRMGAEQRCCAQGDGQGQAADR